VSAGLESSDLADREEGRAAVVREGRRASEVESVWYPCELGGLGDRELREPSPDFTVTGLRKLVHRL
ncbi:MAG: hypothetical protein VXX04_00425, partial [Actinomycetota bacterium]|nr:hypothetical protein [Actinomycetota bacterium]